MDRLSAPEEANREKSRGATYAWSHRELAQIHRDGLPLDEALDVAVDTPDRVLHRTPPPDLENAALRGDVIFKGTLHAAQVADVLNFRAEFALYMAAIADRTSALPSEPKVPCEDLVSVFVESVAHLSREKRATALAERLGVSRRTAARYLSGARRRAFSLDEADNLLARLARPDLSQILVEPLREQYEREHARVLSAVLDRSDVLVWIRDRFPEAERGPLDDLHWLGLCANSLELPLGASPEERLQEAWRQFIEEFGRQPRPLSRKTWQRVAALERERRRRAAGTEEQVRKELSKAGGRFTATTVHGLTRGARDVGVLPERSRPRGWLASRDWSAPEHNGAWED